MTADDRNEDRFWFDEGYSLGATETKRDAVLPRLVGYGMVFGGALWDPLVTGTFLALYALFEISWWHDRCDEAEWKREHADPGPTWEWQRELDDDRDGEL